MKRLLSFFTAVLVIAAGCGTLKDETAATVNGHDISVADVDAFARSDFIAYLAQTNGTALIAADEGTTGSATQRLALSLLVQSQLYADSLESSGDSVSDEELASMEEQIAGFEAQQGPLDSVSRSVVTTVYSRQTAVLRSLTAEESVPVTVDDIQAYIDANPEQFGVVTCFDGFAVPLAVTETAQQLIDGGADIEGIFTNTDLGAQPLSQDGSELCSPVGQVTVPSLGVLIDSGDLGVWASGTLSDPALGEDQTVFIRPNSRGEASAENPSIAASVGPILQEQADADAQEANLAKQNELFATLYTAGDVKVDPRYGSWEPDVENPAQSEPLVAPSVPAVPVSDTPTELDPSALLGG